jgi:hypothetical protein
VGSSPVSDTNCMTLGKLINLWENETNSVPPLVVLKVFN